MPQLQLVQELPQVGRKLRKPVHTFQVRHRPWQIQPMCIAPVLPGETLENALMQARVVTDPIANPLIGWWIEYYFFYVKHRDLDARDTLVSMMLTDASTAALQTAAKVETYHYANAIDWADLCLKRVVEDYFRDEGVAWNAFQVGNLPAASINQDSFWNSAVDDATSVPTANNLQDAPDLTVMSAYQAQYDRMRQMRLTNMSYEDWLKTYGVKGVKESEDIHKPELIRYVRDWSYPTNTVNPTDGAPSSAVSWAVAERFDKKRMFKEPGFIFGVTVARPKVYLKNQRGSGTHLLDNAMSWLPAVLADEPYTSLKEIVATAAIAGPLGVATSTGYWVDVRDLFLYGDQFVNFSLTGTGDNAVALPTATMQKRYATASEADAMFKAAAPANLVRQDGVVNLSILGAHAAHDFT